MRFDPDFWERRLNARKMASTPESTNSDVNPRDLNRSERTRICIPLPSKPRDYVPGSGPPLHPVRLLPPCDSTAYIIERVLLPSPGLAADGKPLPKRMTYLVGWHDLPAARMLVSAMQILDYVSPRTLEEWEWELEQELDEERAMLEEEEKSAAVSTKKRKRGKPPAHSQIESAVVAESETVAKAKARHKKGVMSLSTPQKTRLEEFEGLSDDEETPSRQIAQEAFQRSQGYGSEEVENGGGETDYSTAPISQSSPAGQTSLANDLERELENSVDRSRQPTPGWSWTPLDFSNGTRTSEETNIHQSHLQPTQNGLANQASTLSSFTPAGKSSGRFAPDAPIDPPEQRVPASSASKPTKKKTKNSQKRPRTEDSTQPAKQAGGSGEERWVVERIEDVKYYDVEGHGVVRYFKVRWEGDWPPDQNPTWEPEDNIPPDLVRNYFKMSKVKREALRKKSSPRQKKLTWSMGKQYNSVSEAFAGDQDSVAMGNDVADYEADHLDGDDEQDEFFVVAEQETDEGEEHRKLHGKRTWNGSGTVSTALGLFPAFG